MSELLQAAQNAHRAGRLDEAEATYRKILEADLNNFEAAQLLGMLFVQRRDFAQAEVYLAHALQLNDRVPQIPYMLALTQSGLGHPGDALLNYERALWLKPDFIEALNNRGMIWLEANRGREALKDFDRVLALKPDSPQAQNNRGRALAKLGRPQEALASFDRALTLAPKSADVLNNLGFALSGLGRHDEALSSFQRALQVNPGAADAHVGHGAILEARGQNKEALAAYDKALQLDPNATKGWIGRGSALLSLGRTAEAKECVQRANALNAATAAANFNLGLALQKMSRREEAIDVYAATLEIAPDLPYLRGELLNTRMQICDWGKYDRDREDILSRVKKGEPAIWPFQLLPLTSDAALHLSCAENFTKATHPTKPALSGGPRKHDRIRVAYMSGDFNNHPVASMIVGNLELHDHSKFETFGISIGPDDESEQRKRLEKAFDRFLDGRPMSDADVASGIRELEIDILVDLNGHTTGGRTDILARHPAPIQVNYWGYASTMGATFMDYILVDHVLVPREHEKFYAEKVVALPGCYMPNTLRRPTETTPTRAQCGLPEKGFVFCTFNNSFKITPDIFDVWMRLLRQVPESVLWLLDTSETVKANLAREAQARGVAPNRLVFAPRIDNADHLARHRLADLFLDTLHYNAHTTASEALWCGLPLVTCPGQAFPSRVAASLLTALDLEKLVTSSLQDYEALALELAQHPRRLAFIKKKLTQNRESLSVFNSAKFTRTLETAFEMMWRRHEEGLPPESFDVPAAD